MNPITRPRNPIDRTSDKSLTQQSIIGQAVTLIKDAARRIQSIVSATFSASSPFPPESRESWIEKLGKIRFFPCCSRRQPNPLAEIPGNI